MSNNIYDILKKFNSLGKQSEPQVEQQPKEKSRLQESINTVSEKYMGFKKVAAAAKAGGAKDPDAVAAAIGRKKYGKEKFQKAAAQGKKLGERASLADKVDEVAPPGAKAERMIKHIKKGYAKDGKLTPKEKSIAYATAWKAHKAGKVEEAAQALRTLVDAGMTAQQISEGWEDMMKAVKKQHKDQVGTGKFDKKKVSTGTVYTRKYDADGMSNTDDEVKADGEKRGRGRPKKSAFENKSVVDKMIAEAYQAEGSPYAYRPSGSDIAGPGKNTLGSQLKGLGRNLINKIAPDDETLLKDLEKKTVGEDEDEISSREPEDMKEAEQRLSIGQQMARDGITYSPEREREIIGLIGDYLAKNGHSNKQIRYYLSYDEDFVPDTLSELPREPKKDDTRYDTGWKKSTEQHKDQFGNVIKDKNMAKRLAKQGMKSHMEEQATEDEQMSYEQNSLRQAIGDDMYQEIKASMQDANFDLMANDPLYNALYDYYTDNGEMPYGVAKARTGAPDEWIMTKMEEVFGNSSAQGPEDSNMDKELAEMMKLAGMQVETKMSEDDMEEGNEFTAARVAAIKAGKDSFEVDSKTYKVTGDTSDEKKMEESVTEGEECPKCHCDPCECDDEDKDKVDECGPGYEMDQGQEGRMNVSTNMSSDGNKSVTITADGEAAEELMQMLALAGMKAKQSMPQEENVHQQMAAVEEEKDPRYQASTTPEEEVMPVQTQTKGGNGEVAGKEKKMHKDGAARFSDNPLAMKESVDDLSNMGRELMKEYEALKVQK